MTADLGVFTAAELRAGGINGRGFLQPLLPVPAGVDVTVVTRAAAEGLASRGLLVRRGEAWRAVGRYERVLEAAAVARSLLAVGPADPGAPGFGSPRLVLGCLGTTSAVLDLHPGDDGYRARLVEAPAAAGELVDYLGMEEAVPERAERAEGAAVAAVAAVADVPAISDLDPGWNPVDGLLSEGVATVHVEAASVSQPEGPLLQHRLMVVSTTSGQWLLLGTREGARSRRAAAPAARARAERVLLDLLRGGGADL